MMMNLIIDGGDFNDDDLLLFISEQERQAYLELEVPLFTCISSTDPQKKSNNDEFQKKKLTVRLQYPCQVGTLCEHILTTDSKLKELWLMFF